MSFWLASATFFSSIVGMILIRAPHIRRSTRLKVVANRRSVLDNVLVALVSLGLVLPVAWIGTPVLRFADYAFHPLRFICGVVCLVGGLWFLHRSHRDLGTNWSNTLELRESHQLVTEGVYQHIRHPMYLALLLHGLGQALVLSKLNWVDGPSFLIPFTLLVAFRVVSEERMMVDQFGKAYEAYMGRTKRIVPGVW